MTPRIVHAWPTQVGSEFIFNTYTVLVQAESLDQALETVMFPLREEEGKDFTIEFKGLEVQRKPPGLLVLYKFWRKRVS